MKIAALGRGRLASGPFWRPRLRVSSFLGRCQDMLEALRARLPAVMVKKSGVDVRSPGNVHATILSNSETTPCE